MEIKQRIMTMCVVGAIFTLLVALSDVVLDSNPVSELMLHSPIFQAFLIVGLWFLSPVFASATKINTNEYIRGHTLIIMVFGLLICFIAIAATWLIK